MRRGGTSLRSWWTPKRTFFLVPDADTGIDLGLSCFAAFPDGRTITAPKFLRRAERTLTRLQRALCRKRKGSRNRIKGRVRLARAHVRVVDSRRDWHHKESTRIIR